MIIHTEEKDNKVVIPKDEFEKLLNRLKSVEEVNVIREDFSDLLSASSTGLEFWNNENDDRIWN
jgi:hypothetical protein